MGHLTPDELFEVRKAALAAELTDPFTRDALFEGVLPEYKTALPVLAAPAKQLQSDLLKLNGVGRLIDGKVPFELWLKNAVRETVAAEPRAVLEEAYETVSSQVSSEPEVPDEQIADVPEEIVFEDDTVAYEFLRRGWEAGISVARLKVPQYSGGQPRKINNVDAPPHLGTAWLVSPSLLMTNHHVVASRDGADVDTVDEQDLKLQGAHAVALFDYDSETVQKDPVRCSELLAADRTLDYALLRLESPSGRKPLTLSPDRVELVDDQRLPVNIIQHPGGDPKRVGLRNNLVDKATDRDLRYFTDTRKGSSGSPVLDDRWNVVALHRSSRRIPKVKFQGRDTAVVNVGTQIQAILADLATRCPPAHEEITQVPNG